MALAQHGPEPLAAQYQSVRRGLPVTSAIALADEISPLDKGFRKRLVSTSTLGRAKLRKPSGETVQAEPYTLLSAAMSQKVARVRRVWDRVRTLYKDDDKARRYLNRAHPMLGGETPLDVTLASQAGAASVDRVLDQIEFGFAA